MQEIGSPGLLPNACRFSYLRAPRKQYARLPLLHTLEFGSVAVALSPCFLRRDGNPFFNRRGIVSANLGTNAILEWRNNFSAGSVVLRIRAEYHRHVKRQPNGISLNLNVAFLHDVEKSDLNFSGQIRQFIDGKNPAIGAWKQAVMTVISLLSSCPPRAALIGLISPIKSAIVTSGVASFST